jgi:hypothetical protein
MLYLPIMKKFDGITTKKNTWADRLLFILPALLIAFLIVAIAHDYDFDSRVVMMRYLLFALSGLFAFILPYISFPDPSGKLYQLGNVNGRQLAKLYLTRHRPLWGICILIIIATALADSRGVTNEFIDQVFLMFYGLFFLCGIYLYASFRYLKIGKDSQEWQEGVRGLHVRKRLAEIAKYPVDPGSIPSLINSVVISLIGMLGVVAGAIAFGFSGLLGELLFSFLLLLFGITRFKSLQDITDRLFYQANAFFNEFFGVSAGPESDREPLRIDQLWWIPSRWKANSWGLMLQMDRKLPAGRYIAVGHLFVWVIAYQDAGRTAMIASWLLFAVIHHGLLMLTSVQTIAPRWWLRTLDKPIHWIIGRFWIQVRWLLPLMVSMWVMKWLFGVPQWQDLGVVFITYLLAAVLISAIISFRHERYWVHES